MIPQKPPQGQKSKEIPPTAATETARIKQSARPRIASEDETPTSTDQGDRNKKRTVQEGKSQPRSQTQTSERTPIQETRQQPPLNTRVNIYQEQATSRGKIQDPKQPESEMPPRIIITPPAKEGDKNQDWGKQKEGKKNTWRTQGKATKKQTQNRKKQQRETKTA